MSKKLTNDDFCRASKRLRCEVAAIKAVDDTESKGSGFYPDGFPVILFERHKFRKFTGGRYNAKYPHISGPAGGYGRPGQNQINKFDEAFALDPVAAMKSCSWGRYQIMGFNHEICGFATVGEFVNAMKESEGRQLDAFVGFVIHEHLADELRDHDWAGFAHGYNGADYKKNKYDTKMSAAYKRFAKENIDCSNTSAAVPEGETRESLTENAIVDTSSAVNDGTLTPPQTQPTQTDTVVTETTTETPDGTITEKVMAKAESVGDKFQSVQGVLDKFGFAIEDAKRSVWTVVGYAGKLLFAGLFALWGMFREHPEIFIPAAIGLAVLAYFLWDRSGKRVADAKAGVPVALAEKIIEAEAAVVK